MSELLDKFLEATTKALDEASELIDRHLLPYLRSLDERVATNAAAIAKLQKDLTEPRPGGDKPKPDDKPKPEEKPKPPAPIAIRFAPDQPGRLVETKRGEGAIWKTEVHAAGAKRIGWAVVKGDWSWRGGKATEVDVPASGVVALEVPLLATGDFVKAFVLGSLETARDSGACILAAAPVESGPVDPDDLAFARAWAASVTMGVNIERGWAWDVPGGPAAYSAYLRKQGVDYVRIFFPWRTAFDMGTGTGVPSKASFARILDAAEAYIAAGLKVVLDCTDVLEGWNDLASAQARIYQHIDNCAGWIAERGFDRTKIAVGPVNEWAGDFDYTEHQVAFHRTLRAALPGYVLVCGSQYWKHYSRLVAAPRFVRDDRVIWDHHSYDAKSATEWQDVARQLAAWSAANGNAVTMWIEAGLGFPGWGTIPSEGDDPAAWLRNIDAMFPAMHSQRPAFWAVTYGNGFRMNKSGSDPAFRDASGGPDLAGRLLTLSKAIRAELG